MNALLALLLLIADSRWRIIGGIPAGSDRAGACEKTGHADRPVKLRGRLYAAEGGGSGYRIWLVGTNRIVWVSAQVDPPLPDAIVDAFKPFDEQMYGDFTLIPLGPDRPGVMREVCFVSGENLVVRDVQTGRARQARE